MNHFNSEVKHSPDFIQCEIRSYKIGTASHFVSRNDVKLQRSLDGMTFANYFKLTFDHSVRHDVDIAIVSSVFGTLRMSHIFDAQYCEAPLAAQHSAIWITLALTCSKLFTI